MHSATRALFRRFATRIALRAFMGETRGGDERGRRKGRRAWETSGDKQRQAETRGRRALETSVGGERGRQAGRQAGRRAGKTSERRAGETSGDEWGRRASPPLGETRVSSSSGKGRAGQTLILEPCTLDTEALTPNPQTAPGAGAGRGATIPPGCNEVYYTACSLLVILNNACGQPQCQKGCD